MVEFLGKFSTDYLDVLKAAIHAEKVLSYEELALEPASTVLEVGCGPATDTLALAELVGVDGRVVGVDFDPEMIVEANDRARRAGLDVRVTHQWGDAAALPFADNTFDACRSERVFQHLPDPARALAEMVRVTRHGGRIVVFDTDWGTVVVDSPEPAIEWRLRQFYDRYMVTNPYSGRQLYRLFRETQVRDVRVVPRSMVSLDLSFVRIGGSLDELATKALDAGVVTGEELARWEAGLATADANGTFFCCWTMMLASGTKP